MSDVYSQALSDACAGFEALRPPTRMSVSEGVAKNLVIQQPGAPRTPWAGGETPYMTHPIDALASRKHEAVVFVGPARTGKTAGLLLGWMAHNVVNDPGDMLFIQMSKDKAREFSKTDVDRAIRYSPNVQAMKSERNVDSNTFDTMFRHGMWLRIAWPTVSNVSGSTYRYVAITDIDRIENAENVDGEGPLFDLAKKRTTTFLSRGMTLVESSPGKAFEDPKWQPATAHEAPPTGGILSLYNRSDRHRFYWRCPDCRERFEAAPGLKLFKTLPDAKTLLEEVRTANIPAMAAHHGRVACPWCGAQPEHRFKGMLNKGGLWVPDGCVITADDELIGDPLTSTIRGYWLGGVAATYQSWESIVAQYLYGLQEYALTGSEEKLKQTTNTDQGMPYMARHLSDVRNQASSPRDRAETTLLRYVVPEEARFVQASVDVQGGQNARFDVQIHAVGVGGEQWTIDRFAIKDSLRPGTIKGEFAPIDPASYPEDWDVLTEKLLRATWRTSHDNLEMQLLGVIVDTGGEGGRMLKRSGKGAKTAKGAPADEKGGVTHNAYAWYRRAKVAGFAKRVFLYKGGSSKEAPEMRETMVGKIGAKGRDDVPLLHCNPNKLSSAVDANLRRSEFGPGYVHFPAPQHPVKNPDGWVTAAFFDELEAEIRNPDGTWSQIRARNETFDHCRMQRALMLRLGVFRVNDWAKVPKWFAPLQTNSMGITKQDRRDLQANAPVRQDPVQQPVQTAPVRRRVRRSSVASL